jgi:hypothetical protein
MKVDVLPAALQATKKPPCIELGRLERPSLTASGRTGRSGEIVMAKAIRTATAWTPVSRAPPSLMLRRRAVGRVVGSMTLADRTLVGSLHQPVTAVVAALRSLVVARQPPPRRPRPPTLAAILVIVLAPYHLRGQPETTGRKESKAHARRRPGLDRGAPAGSPTPPCPYFRFVPGLARSTYSRERKVGGRRIGQGTNRGHSYHKPGQPETMSDRPVTGHPFVPPPSSRLACSEDHLHEIFRFPT